MAKVKVDAKLFGIKQPVVIKGSIGELIKLDELIKMSFAAANTGEDDFEAANDKEIEFYKQASETISELLRIKPEKVLDNADPQSLGRYLGYLKARINGLSEGDVQAALHDDEEAPKEPAEKSANNDTK